MNLLNRLTEYFENKPKPFLIMVNIALLLCIGFVAYITGYDMSLFYLIPISFAAWFGGRPRSIIVSFLSVLTIAVSDFMAEKQYPYFFVELWNLLMHFGFFAVYAVVLSLVKADLDERKMLLVEIQKGLSEVKLLSGLLPICASCKKIRDDKGYWKQMEAYISAHSEAQFTHGICPECAKRLYPKDWDDIFGKKEGKQ